MEKNHKYKNEKVRIGFYIEKSILEQCDSLLEKTNCRSRNEFVNNALKFYIGYETTKKIEGYMLKTLSSVLLATVHDSENRIVRIIFKLAVEISMLCHVVAYSHNIGNEDLEKLRWKCVDEVKKINGSVKFDDAWEYQRGE